MSFDTNETSLQSGKPISLFEFRLGKFFWRYTSADRDITATGFGGVNVLYSTMAITDAELTVGGDASQDDYNLTIQTDCQLVKLFKGTPPLDTVWVTVRRVHFGDTDNNASVVHWIGSVSSVKRADAVSSTVVCNTLGVTFSRGGLRLAWETNCPRILYDPGCGVDKDAFGVSATLVAMTGNSITAPEIAAKAQGYFDGGFIEWKIDDETFVRRGLLGDTGQTLTAEIDTPSNALVPHITSTGASMKDEGPDYPTILAGMYSGQIIELHETDGTNYFFLRRDKDAFVAPEDAYSSPHWVIVYSQDDAVLYRWDNAVAFPDQGNFAGSTLTSQSGDEINEITVLGTTDGLTIGTQLRLYPGCDRTTGANGCAKFNNIANYGGIPQLSGRSPFDGDPVF